MMHYRKGENIEQEITKDNLPFDDCLSKLPQKDFLWMHVRGGTKVHNVIRYVKNALDKGDYRTVIWSGSGGGVVKTVSCAEILKRSYTLYQLTRMDQLTIEEHWEPQMEGLEGIVAKRKVPSLHILMTLDPIDESISDVQKPNETIESWLESSESEQQSQPHSEQQREGQAQRQRHQQHNPHRQRQEQRADAQAGQKQERRQKPQWVNRNRGEQRENLANPSRQPQVAGGSQQQREQSSEGQQRQQQAHKRRRPKPKQKPEQRQPTQVDGASTSTQLAVESMEN